MFDINLAKAITKFCRERNLEFILDLGCGTGEYVNYFNEQVGEIMAVGCDIDKEKIAIANKGRRLPLCYEGDLKRLLTFKFGMIPDLVISIGAINTFIAEGLVGNMLMRTRTWLILDFGTFPMESYGQITDMIEHNKFKYQPEVTQSIAAEATHFKDSLMVFKRV